jgi:hypothetical protein
MFNQNFNVMEETSVGALISVVLFLVIGLSWYFYLQARTKERLACIEKGLNVLPGPQKQSGSRKTIFTIGLFFVGISLGLLIGNLLDDGLGVDEGIAYTSMIFLFGGLSLVISHLIKFKKEE